jgi:hypothetical protein
MQKQKCFRGPERGVLYTVHIYNQREKSLEIVPFKRFSAGFTTIILKLDLRNILQYFTNKCAQE